MFSLRRKQGGSDIRAAWALKLRSPFRASAPVSSWLGGAPSAPPQFKWPKGKDGKYRHFLGQIDLQRLEHPEGASVSIPGLPKEGALLAFTGASYLLTAQDLESSRSVDIPTQLAPRRELGFFDDAPTFKCWPIDAVAYVSARSDERRPDVFPDRLENPEDWIVNCAVANLEAELLFVAVSRQIAEAASFFQSMKRPHETELPPRTQEVLEQKNRVFGSVMDAFPPFLMAIRDYQAYLRSQPSTAPIDPAVLNEFFATRADLNARIELNFSGVKDMLAGNARKVWESILHNTAGLNEFSDYARIDERYHSFMDLFITDWRGHRLFGFEPEFPNNHENLKGMSPVISIAADRLLGTQSEHEYGMSNWCSDKMIAKGKYDQGRFIRHCAV